MRVKFYGRDLKKMMIFLAIFACTGLWSVEASSIIIWTKTKFENVVVLPHFWKNTGLCPASEPKLRTAFLLSHDEKLNLDFIGALPNGAIRMVRIHWLLDLVTVGEIRSNEPIFQFQHLDRLIDRLHRNGLSPSFELMGNPSNYFHDFKIQSKYWTALIEQIVERYSNMFGAYYVHGWRFELMNEPDLKMYNFFNATLENYLEYFRASEAAVRSISGPAGLFRDNKKSHPLCWGLLDYCSQNLCNLNMITFHRKGGQIGSQVVEQGLELINSLVMDYPSLKGTPFGNDESDIMTGWHKPMEWRADVRYAALVVQVVIGHIEEMLVKRNLPFEMLSNDNAFLSFSPNYFTQRTLLARFQMNNTSPPHVQFFKKPVYSAMALLSLLGIYLKDVRYHPGEKGYSYLVTTQGFQDTFVGVITNDRVENETYTVNETTTIDVTLRISLGNLTFSGMCVGYIMDNVQSNPYQIWKDAGSPDFPDFNLRRRMRKAEGFKRFALRRVRPHQGQVKFFLKGVLIPSVFSINVCFEETDEPGQVTDLRYQNITHNEVMLTWKDTLVDSKCLLTYIVEFKSSNDSTFRRINDQDSIFLSYHFDGVIEDGSEVGVVGVYRVAAVDYWNRHGPFSDNLTVFT